MTWRTRPLWPTQLTWSTQLIRSIWPAWAAWLMALVAAVAQFVVTRRHHNLGMDLRPMYLSGGAILHGRPIYDVPGFVYPPPAALIGVVLQPLPFTVWANVYLAVELAVLAVLAAVTVGWLVPSRWKAPAGGVAATLLIWAHPSMHGLWLGNISVAIAGVGLGVVVAFARGRWTLGCLLLGLSLLVKPLLLPLVLIPLLVRRVRPLAVAGAVSAVVLVASCLVTAGLARLPQVLAKVAHGSVLVGRLAANNLSLNGFATVHHVPRPALVLAQVAVVGAAVAVAVVVLRARPPVGAAALACLSSVLVLVLLLAGSLSEVHYVFAALPGGFAALALRRSNWVRAAVAVGAMATFVPLRHVAPVGHQTLLVVSELAFFIAGVLAFLLPPTAEDAAPLPLGSPGRQRSGQPPAVDAAGTETATTASPSTPSSRTGTSVQER